VRQNDALLAALLAAYIYIYIHTYVCIYVYKHIQVLRRLRATDCRAARALRLVLPSRETGGEALPMLPYAAVCCRILTYAFLTGKQVCEGSIKALRLY
jgi:hypothetical protein